MDIVKYFRSYTKFLKERKIDFACVVLLFFIGLWLYPLHAVPVLVGSDPIAYASQAIAIAKLGRTDYYDHFFDSFNSSEYSSNNLMIIGFTASASDKAHFVPSGMSIGLPILLSVSFEFLGYNGLYYLVPFSGVLLLVTAFIFFRLFIGTRASFIAVLFLALIAPNNWFGRILMSDVISEFFVLSTMLFAVLTSRRRVWFLGAITGFAFGASFLVRYTNVLLAIPLLCFFATLKKPLSFEKDKKMIGAFFAAAGIIGFLLLVYNFLTFGNPFVTSYGIRWQPLLSANYVSQGLTFYAEAFWKFLTPLGIHLILLGLGVCLLRRKNLAVLAVTWSVPFILFYSTWNIFDYNSPDMSFRFLLQIVPVLALLLGVLVDECLREKNILVKITILAAVALLLYTQWEAMTGFGIQGGYISVLDQIESRAPHNQVIFVDGMWGTANMGQTVLRFTNSDSVVALPLEKGSLNQLVDKVLDDHESTYFLVQELPKEIVQRNDLEIIRKDEFKLYPDFVLTLFEIRHKN